MSEPTTNEPDEPAAGIADEDLPEDLQPSDDNPLAQPLDDDEAKSDEELDMKGGKTPEESPDEGDEDDSDD